MIWNTIYYKAKTIFITNLEEMIHRRLGPLDSSSELSDGSRSFLKKSRGWLFEYFIGQLFTLYRYIIPISKYQVRYDRYRFGKTVENIADGYDLKVFWSTKPQVPEREFPMEIKSPIVIQPIFMWAMSIRCACVTFIPVLTRDPFLRSWWGIDVWHGNGGMYADISIMLWSNLCALFLKFGLSNRLLDYKFMNLYFIARDGPDWLNPKLYDLEDEDYEKFRKFRKGCLQIQLLITFTAFPVGVIFQLFVYWYNGYLFNKTLPTLIWFTIYFFWFAYICFRKYLKVQI